ncbi:serine hydrolase domain-containing protein [Aquimarina sp. 2201CG5-10]|uniref:serine hydrolase domain-containing protein n=1 Tax=Aquimarina callyspongiae TaxID=3098150 RepID=UPI002AB356BE|nr:serine hydrolase domain-containing protein [Aquimarina sp. 2201CG5-10]MDY8137475.1 serine hydrolase domain-containing protein [Aquimarina sp. 2201CG5-10]
MNKLILIVFLTFVIISCKQQPENTKNQTKDYTSIKDSLTSKLDIANSDGKIVGFSVAMVDTTGMLYSNSFGYSDLASKKEYSTKTVQYVASVSKTLIGISLFKAQELGKLNIDEPINNYLPFEVINPEFPKIPITIRQLAIHTSSIRDSDIFWENNYFLVEKDNLKDTDIPEYFNQPKSKISISEFLGEIFTKNGKLNSKENFSKNKPNQKFNYSNVGSTLCALVIEKTTGIPYQEFTKKHILEPLNMNSSSWTIEEVDSKNRSTLYATNQQIMADYTTIDFPSSGLITSNTDLGKYLTELTKGYSGKGAILSKSSYNELFKKQLIPSQLPEGVNANVGIFMDYSKRGIGYSGYDPGLMAYMYFNPKSLIGKIVIINTDTDFDKEVRLTLDKIWNILEQYETELN